MPDINQIKEFLCSAYPGNRWKKRVERMGDMQIIAVWSRLKNKKVKEDKKDIPEKKEEVQLSLFEDN